MATTKEPAKADLKIEPEYEEIDLPEEEEEQPAGFTALGKNYVLKYSKKRIELYEQRHKPIMAIFIQNGGAMSINELSELMAYGLMEEGGDFTTPRFGKALADRVIEGNGYLAAYEAVTDALQRDCAFLFEVA